MNLNKMIEIVTAGLTNEQIVQQGIRLYDNDNYKSALPFIIKAIEFNHCGALRRAAYLNSEGLGGLQKNPEEANLLYFRAIEPCKLAAAQGDADAQAILSRMYFFGEGRLEKDEAKAMELLKSASDKGSAYAQNRLAFHYFSEKSSGISPEEIFRLTSLASTQGHLVAQHSLAVMYLNGYGCRKNESEAFRILKSASDQGYALAQYNVAVMYLNGEVQRGGLRVERDRDEAVRLFHLAAEQGHAESQYNLGILYKDGTGVKKNLAASTRLFKLSADQGYALAQNNLAVTYFNGDVVVKNLTEAVRLYTLAAEQGNSVSQKNIALMYETGNGVEQNNVKAVYWYIKSAEQGDDFAKERLEGFVRSQILNEIEHLENQTIKMYIWQHMSVNIPSKALLAKNNVIKMTECGIYISGVGHDEFVVSPLFSGQEEGCKLIIRDLNFNHENDYLNLSLINNIEDFNDIKLVSILFEGTKAVAVLNKKDGHELVTLLNVNIEDLVPTNFIFGNGNYDAYAL